MTIFLSLQRASGLQPNHLAELFEVRLDTIRHWSTGRRDAPESVLTTLSNVVGMIEAAVDNGLRDIKAKGSCAVHRIIDDECQYVVAGRIISRCGIANISIRFEGSFLVLYRRPNADTVEKVVPIRRGDR